MSTIATRLDQAMTAAGFPSQSALSRASGVPQPTINRILKGVGKGQPETLTIRRLAQACNVSFDWLNEGIGAPGRGATKNSPGSEVAAESEKPSIDDLRKLLVPKPQSEIIEIPVVDISLSAGIAGFHVEFDESQFREPIAVTRKWVEANGLILEKLLATTARGASMRETISDGDTVVINTASTEPKDDKIFAVNFGGEAVIKRLIRDFGRWFLTSDNPDQKRYPRAECTSETCILIGEVVLAQRNFLSPR